MGRLKMQDLENDGPGHFEADVVCIYAFCVVCNFFHIVIGLTDASALISGCNEADITRSMQTQRLH